MDRQTYTIPEYCRIVGIGRGAGYEAAKRGQLGVPVLRIGRRLLVPRAAVNRVLEGPMDDGALQVAAQEV